MLFSFISFHTFSLSHFQSKNNISKYFNHYVINSSWKNAVPDTQSQTGESGPSWGGWPGTRLDYEASKQLLILQGLSAPMCVLWTQRARLWPICPDICLRWNTDGTLVPRALSITHERTMVPWQSRGHSGLWGQQETTLAAKGSSSAATLLCCWQSAQPPCDSIIILFRQEDQGSLTLG